MVDIHCHVLPEIDDGSKSKMMSLQMCAMAADSGVTDIIATPHMIDFFKQDIFFERVSDRMKYMEEKLKSENIPVKLHTGAEVFASEDILCAPDLSRLALASSRYLLVEFSFTSATLAFVRETVETITEQNLVPVIAHPERYSFTISDYSAINTLAQDGALFQCNLSSLAGDLGKAEYKLAQAMVNAGAVSFLASDAHRVEYRNTDITGIVEYIKRYKKKVNTDNFNTYLLDNPNLILENAEVPHPDFEPLGKHRRFF